MKVKFALMCWAAVLGGAFAENQKLSLEDELKRFQVPGAVLDDSDLGEVLEALERSCHKYAEAFSQRETMLKLELEVSEGHTATLTGTVPDQSVRSTLHQIAGQAGCTVSIEENRVVLQPIPEKPDRGEFQFSVHPHFLDHLGRRAEWSAGQSEVPAVVPGNESLQKAFSELGLLVGEKSRVSFDPKSSHLNVKATRHEKERIATFLRSLKEGPRQIRLTTRIVLGPADLTIRSGEFTPVEIGEMMRSASQVEGTEFMTLPSLIMRPGSDAVLDLTTAHSLFDDDGKTGPEIKGTLNLRGPGICGRLRYEHGVKHPGAEEIEKRSAVLEIGLRDHHALVEKVTTEDGTSEYLVVTAEVIDATGRRVRKMGD